MTEQKTKRPVWKSPFKMGLLVLSALAYAPACIFETRLPGDSEWLYCYLIIFIGSLVAALFEPERFLETAAMPFFAVLILGFTGLGGPFFLVTMIFVLTASVPAAFLGSAARRLGDMITGLSRRNRGTHNHTPDGICQPADGLPKPSL
jgi:hypothetical protein